MTTWIALLRGINVGGHHKVPMKDLRAILAENGIDARTYIQSGNVVFDGEAEEKALAARLSALIEDRFGFAVPVILRTAEELENCRDRNPFPLDEEPTELRFRAVLFLSESPNPEAVATLDPNRSPPDRFIVSGREIYVIYPNGSARSKLTNAYFDRALKTTVTARNWRTLLKLIEMGRG